MTLINECPDEEAHFSRPQNVLTFTRSRENSVGLNQVEQYLTDREFIPSILHRVQGK